MKLKGHNLCTYIKHRILNNAAKRYKVHSYHVKYIEFYVFCNLQCNIIIQYQDSRRRESFAHTHFYLQDCLY